MITKWLHEYSISVDVLQNISSPNLERAWQEMECALMFYSSCSSLHKPVTSATSLTAVCWSNTPPHASTAWSWGWGTVGGCRDHRGPELWTGASWSCPNHRGYPRRTCPQNTSSPAQITTAHSTSLGFFCRINAGQPSCPLMEVLQCRGQTSDWSVSMACCSASYTTDTLDLVWGNFVSWSLFSRLFCFLTLLVHCLVQ